MALLCAGIIELAKQIVAWVSKELEARGEELATLEQAAALEPVTAAASPAGATKRRKHLWNPFCSIRNSDHYMRSDRGMSQQGHVLSGAQRSVPVHVTREQQSQERTADAAPPPRSEGPPKPLPPGFTFRIVKSPAKPRGYGEYVAECPVHGRYERRMDRWDNVGKFFESHANCR